MATDKRLDQVSQLTDFDYALIVKGDQVAKASKQQLAELVGDLLYGATNASSLATVVAGFIGYTRRIITIEPGEFYKLPERYGFVILSLPYYSQIGVLCYRDSANDLLFTSNNAVISIDNSYLQITSEGDETKFKNNTSRTLEVVFNIIK